jgi:hypothetical protein
MNGARAGRHFSGVNQRPGWYRYAPLEADYALSLQTLGSLLDFKFHRLPFVEGLVALGLDGGEMDKNILAGLSLDETVSLGRIKPLDCSLLSAHFDLSYSID